MTVLAYNIQWWRAQRGVSLVELAQAAGVAEPSLQALERGEEVDRQILWAVAAEIGMDPRDAVGMMHEPADDVWERDIEIMGPDPVPATAWPLASIDSSER